MRACMRACVGVLTEGFLTALLSGRPGSFSLTFIDSRAPAKARQEGCTVHSGDSVSPTCPHIQFSLGELKVAPLLNIETFGTICLHQTLLCLKIKIPDGIIWH